MKKNRILLLAGAWLILLGLTVIPVVHLGNLGYLCVCDFMIMTACTFMSPSTAMLYASSATALGDIILGYGVFAPYTFAIRALQGWLIAYMSHRKAGRISIVLVSGCVVLFGYAAAVYVMYGSLQVAMTSLGYDLIQVAICTAAALLFARYGTAVSELVRKYME